MKKYAAIDIGSNAIRLLIVSVPLNNLLKQNRHVGDIYSEVRTAPKNSKIYLLNP